MAKVTITPGTSSGSGSGLPAGAEGDIPQYISGEWTPTSTANLNARSATFTDGVAAASMTSESLSLESDESTKGLSGTTESIILSDSNTGNAVEISPDDITLNDTSVSVEGHTHTGLANLPSSGEKLALAGTSGTPGTGNEYVTKNDAVNTNARTPTAHNHYSAFVQLTDQASITCDLSTGDNFYVTLAGSRNFDFSNGTAGQSGIVRIAQDNPGGSRTLTWNAHLFFVGGVDPTLTSTAGAVDILVYTVYSATVIYCQLLTNMG
jgi:hypothetical protein